MHRVRISSQAERDLRDQFAWWSENRSLQQARRWFEGIRRAINSLAANPDKRPKAPEDGRWPFTIRQLVFGLGRTPSHRAVFRIDREHVIVLRVRHLAQDELGAVDVDTSA
jgi:plasmid stabilization system protein ParE